MIRAIVNSEHLAFISFCTSQLVEISTTESSGPRLLPGCWLLGLGSGSRLLALKDMQKFSYSPLRDSGVWLRGMLKLYIEKRSSIFGVSKYEINTINSIVK